MLQSHRQVSNCDDEAWIALVSLKSLMITGLETVMNLTGRLSKRGVISPDLDVQLKNLQKWQNNH